MMLIFLTILVSIVPSESSLVKAHNDHCKYSEIELQPFEKITNSSLRSFLFRKLGGIANTACVQSYQVELNSDSSPFYVFRIDRQTRFLQNYTVCGVVTVADGGFKWKSCDKAKFKDYLIKCEGEDGSETRHPQLPPPTCDQTPTPVPRVSPPNKVTPPTPAPRQNPPSKVTPPTPAPRQNPPSKVTPPTPHPRTLTTRVVTPTIPPRAVAYEKSTTRKGFLSKLNCFSCL